MSSLSNQSLNNLVPLNQKDSRTIAFIDSSITDCEYIAQKVIPRARSIIIGSEDDGVQAISTILNDSNCLEIHVFTSGFPGCIYLGNSELNLRSFKTYYLSLKNWFNNNNLLINLVKNLPCIYIYSSNLNIGDAGEEFITKLSQFTGAKVFILPNTYNSNILNHAS